MKNNNADVETYSCRILKMLSEKSKSSPNFSGTGLILYDPNIFDKKLHADLRPTAMCPAGINLHDIEKTVSLLMTISDRSHTLHDGFHMFDKTGSMTHVAQYFFPPIVSGLVVNERYGTRYHSALYGSCIDGIILTGVINGDRQYHIFKKGFKVLD